MQDTYDIVGYARISVDDPSQTALDKWQKFSFSRLDFARRIGLA